MKSNNLYILLFITFLLSSCKIDKESSNTPNSNIMDTNLKDISELTFIEIYRTLYKDGNGGFDAHGDLYGQDAVSYLSFFKEPSSCGNLIYVSNRSQDSIILALKSSFNFPGNPNKEMLRAYKVPPNEKTPVGNSKFCYNGNTYDIKKEITSAGFSRN
ncbi:hypothetical protein [uncultured Psychroserpens sp.]|uniref:hypothetical protein n=1 Tax=uncultured Psychroserpens sp. TaxID=255436 RepID=UPI00260E2A73|nr:hypothetical protein [uncultured Psychroserpens sp.]